MDTNGIMGARPLGLAAGAAALAFALATASPAAAAPSSASVANDALTVSSGSGADRIALRLAAGAPGTLEVDFGDDGSADFSFDRATFSRIDVSAGSGDDQVRIDEVNGTFEDEATTIYGGSGSDTIDGGQGAELLIGGSGSDVIDGNRGNDTAHLGSGNDSFRWDPGDGSDTIGGHSGTDTLDFNGADAVENMRLSPNGERSLFFRDAGNINMDMDDVEQLDLTTLGGVDTFTAEDMSGTDFVRADVDLSGSAGGGDGASDVVTVNATADDDQLEVSTDGTAVEVEGLQTTVGIVGSETIDKLQVNTLQGDDAVDVDDAVSALIEVFVDLGDQP